jgi:hypothetical protein
MKQWMRRQQALVDYTLAALARRRGKNFSLLTIYTVVVFVIASAMLFATALRHEAEVVLADAPELIVQNLVMGRHDMISGGEIAKLEAIRGVVGVKGRLWGYFYDSINGANYTFMVPDDPALIPPDKHVSIGEGIVRTRELEWEKAPLFVSRRPGEALGFHVHERLSPDSALVSSDLVLINEAGFRDFFGLPDGVYTDIAVSIRNTREVGTIMSKAESILPTARFITRDEIQVALAGAALLAFAIFAAEKASGLSAEEAREIGILKAVGWDTGDVIAMKLWEGLLISTGAFLIGAVLAYLHVFAFGAGLFDPILKGWAVIYPDFALTPMIDGVQIASLMFLTVLPYTAATLVPIWRAATADPDQVMR